MTEPDAGGAYSLSTGATAFAIAIAAPCSSLAAQRWRRSVGGAALAAQRWRRSVGGAAMFVFAPEGSHSTSTAQVGGSRVHLGPRGIGATW